MNHVRLELSFLASVFKGRSLLAVSAVIFLGFFAVVAGIKLDNIVTSKKHLTTNCKATPEELQDILSDALYDHSLGKGTVSCSGRQTKYGFPFRTKTVFQPDDQVQEKVIDQNTPGNYTSWNVVMVFISYMILSYIIWRNSALKTP